MKILLTPFLILLAVLAFSQGNNNPEVGSKAPDFSLKTIRGDKITLSKMVQKQPVVLIVLRGWPGYQCPVCTKQVGGLVEDGQKFSDLKSTVLMVYPGPSDELQEHAREFSEDFSFPENFYFTLDPDYSMINEYGLRWDDPKETAYPSTFVINKEGTIVFAKISTTHGGRADNEEIFKVLSSIEPAE